MHIIRILACLNEARQGKKTGFDLFPPVHSIKIRVWGLDSDNMIEGFGQALRARSAAPCVFHWRCALAMAKELCIPIGFDAQRLGEGFMSRSQRGSCPA